MMNLNRGSGVHVTAIAHGKDRITGHHDGHSGHHALSHELVTDVDRAAEPEPCFTEYHRLLPERGSPVAPDAHGPIRNLDAVQQELAAPGLCRPEISHGLCLIRQ